jgi:hypothetical protein
VIFDDGLLRFDAAKIAPCDSPIRRRYPGLVTHRAGVPPRPVPCHTCHQEGRYAPSGRGSPSVERVVAAPGERMRSCASRAERVGRFA